MQKELMLISEDDIKNKIYNIRGKGVMLDSDLAKIYGYTTKDFNRQVKNNIERFDDDFRFQLTRDEYLKILRCKNCTLELEQGIYMLMTVLKGEKAVLQSKTLIRIFRRLKDYVIDNNLIEQKYINKLVLKHDNKFIGYDSKFDNKDDIDNLINKGEKICKKN